MAWGTGGMIQAPRDTQQSNYLQQISGAAGRAGWNPTQTGGQFNSGIALPTAGASSNAIAGFVNNPQTPGVATPAAPATSAGPAAAAGSWGNQTMPAGADSPLPAPSMNIPAPAYNLAAPVQDKVRNDLWNYTARMNTPANPADAAKWGAQAMPTSPTQFGPTTFPMQQSAMPGMQQGESALQYTLRMGLQPNQASQFLASQMGGNG